MITTKQLSVAYGDKTIIENLSVSIPKGKVTALIGPNGCGKSTLLKALSRINRIKAGDILLESESITSIKDKQLAQRLSLLPQTVVSPEGITVRKLVEYGRAPYVSHWGRLSTEDKLIVEQAMLETGVAELGDEKIESLSGGQRQRAWIAMILAQDTEVVMLDEPTTYLDLSHQIELMKMMRSMNEQGKTVIVVLHDLNQACRYCDHLIVLNQGQVVSQGAPQKVFTEQLLEEVFNLDAVVINDPVADTPMCIAR
ncbi:Fe(3+) dicitrate ABC transporter ATP-binding protein FecE [Vibrio atypicus]|uniref:Fe(3+) dicitrate ABC transporter ATP-binding protein FecE n=1 Tax=Vibrio atypicus TaxID=558271 RepID=UPI00135881AF|nr:Fe(3+) dicitrate ABC transporter ATP-binding protein FecE [Vibrio atypicus]